MTDRELLARSVYTLCDEMGYSYLTFLQGYPRIRRALEGLEHLGCDMQMLWTLNKQDREILWGDLEGDAKSARRYAQNWLLEHFPGCDQYDSLPEK